MHMYSFIQIVSWSLYDMAAKFFGLSLVSLYFVRWLTLVKGVPDIVYSATFGVSMVVVALLAPISGRIGDVTNRKKVLLTVLTVCAVGCTLLLEMTTAVLPALILFAVANMCVQTAAIFYNALIRDIAPPQRVGLVSGTGKAFGYAGSLAVLLIIKPIVVERGFHAAFFPSGALFMLFALPCLIFVKEKQAEVEADWNGLGETIRSLRESLPELIKRPGINDFLKAAFWAVAPVNAVILFMSLYLTRVYGLSESRILQFLVFSGAFAVAGSFGLGHLSDRIGYKRGLYLVLIALTAGFFAAAFAGGQAWYPWIAAVFGIAFGGIWTVSRAMGARLVPQEKIGELFGLFALVAYIAALAGPLLWGVLVLLMTPLGILRYRITVFVLGMLPLISFIYLKRVSIDFGGEYGR